MAIFNSYIWHRKVYFVISIILMMIASIAEPVHWKAKKRNSAEAVTLLHYLDVSQFQSFRTNLSILDDQIQFFSVGTPNLFTKNSRFVIGRFQVANICPASIRADNLSLFAACNGSRRPDRGHGLDFWESDGHWHKFTLESQLQRPKKTIPVSILSKHTRHNLDCDVMDPTHFGAQDGVYRGCSSSQIGWSSTF